MDIIANLVGLIVVPFLAFYFLGDWHWPRLMMINLFTYDTRPKVAHILDEIGRTLSAYIQGLGKLSLIAGACITVGVAILGIQFRWFWFPGGHGRDCAGSWSLDGCCAGGIYRVFAKILLRLFGSAVYLVFIRSMAIS